MYAHRSLQRCTCTHMSTWQCIMLAKPHTEMMPRIPNWQAASHQLPNFRQDLQQAEPKVKEPEWLWLPDFFFPYFMVQKATKITKYWRLKCFFFFFLCVLKPYKMSVSSVIYYGMEFIFYTILVWHRIYLLWKIKVNETV